MKLKRFLFSLTLNLTSLLCLSQSPVDRALADWNNAEYHDTARLKSVLNASSKIWRTQPDIALWLLHKSLPLAEKTEGRWKLSIFELIASSHLAKSQFDSSIKYCNKAFLEGGAYLTPKISSSVHFTIGHAYTEMADFDSASAHLSKAKLYAVSTNDTATAVNVAVSLARIFGFQGNYTECEKQLKWASKLVKGSRFRYENAMIRSNWGGVKILQGDYKGAVKLLMESLKLHESLGNLRGQANVTGQIGNLYQEANELDLSLKYLRSSMRIADKTGNKLQYAGSCLDISTTLYKMKAHDSSITLAKKALGLFQKLGHPSGIAYANNTIGTNLLYLHDYTEALRYFEEARKVAEVHAIDLDKVQSNMARAYLGLQNYSQALEFATHAMNDAKRKNSIVEVSDAAEVLYRCYDTLKNYKKALEMYNLFIETRDSINDKEKQRELIHREYKYQYEKEAMADSLRQIEDRLIAEAAHQKELGHKNRTRNLLLGSGLILLIIAGGAWNRTRYIKKVNQKLAAEKQRAEESEAFKQQFLANMSHEIRTPMNAILGMTNLTLDTKLSKKQKDYLDGVKNSAEGLLVIINDILDLSKLEAGKLELEHIPFEVRKLAEEVHTTLRFKAEDKGLAFPIEIDPLVPPFVKGDPSRIRQVLLNLCGNAIKFTDTGHVNLKVYAKDDNLAFSVSDTGVGIAKDVQNKLFESFQQADKSTTRKYGGTGLGLSISKTLVQLMRGDLSLTSEPGVGSEFVFSIPLEKATESEVQSRGPEISFDLEGLKGLRVLVAEDNKYNQIVVLDTLQHLVDEVTVDIANNGRVALDMIQQKDYDLVLMDSDMPEMDGREATRRIRALDSAKKDIPIIALTSSVLASEISKCLEAGMNDAISKPFQRKEFFGTISKYYSK